MKKKVCIFSRALNLLAHTFPFVVVKKRAPLSQRLAERSGVKVDPPIRDDATHGFRPRRPSTRRPQDGYGERGRSRSPSRNQHSPRSHAAPRTGQGKRPPMQGQPRQRPGSQQPGSGQQFRSGQARSGASSRGPRGQQRGGGGRGQTSASNARRFRSNEGARTGRAGPARTKDPELNDYPNELYNPPPVRKYDDNGILELKGRHEQITPVVPSVLPKLPTPSATASAATASSALKVISYLDRAPPVPVSNASIVDDASRALSRVRELDMPRRRNALGIVERMAKTAGELEKRATANA